MGSVRASPPLSVHGSRHFEHSSRFPAPLAHSGLRREASTPVSSHTIECAHTSPGGAGHLRQAIPRVLECAVRMYCLLRARIARRIFLAWF